ncbi:MAG: hypothetical protein Kow0059_17450 [Candidatus Sumerlaeia bacterium]
MKKTVLVAVLSLFASVVMAQTIVVDGVGPDDGNSPFKTLEAAIEFFKGPGNTSDPNVINITYNLGATSIDQRILPDELNAGTVKAYINNISGGLTIDGNPGGASQFPAVFRQANKRGELIPTGYAPGSDSQSAAIVVKNAGDIIIKNIVLYPTQNNPGANDDGAGAFPVGGIAVLAPGAGNTSNVTLENVVVTGKTTGGGTPPDTYPAGPIMPGLPYPADAYYAPGIGRFYGPGNLYIGPSNAVNEVLNVTVRDSSFLANRSYNGRTVGGVHVWGNNGTIRFEGIRVQSVGAVSIWCENADLKSTAISLPYQGSITITKSATRRSAVVYAGRSSGVEGVGAISASDGLRVAELSYTDFYRIDGQTADSPPEAILLGIASGATIGTIHHNRFMDANINVPAIENSIFLKIDTTTGFITTVYDNTFDNGRGFAGKTDAYQIGPNFGGASELVFFNNIITGGDATDGNQPDTFNIDAGATGKVRFLNNVIASTGTPTDEYVGSPFFSGRAPDEETGTLTDAPNYEERSGDRNIANYTNDYDTSPVLRAQTTYTGQGFAGLDVQGWNAPAASSTAGTNPASYDFGEVPFGLPSPMSFDVTSAGGGSVITGFDVSGYGAGDVQLVNLDLPLAVSDSGSEQVDVVFTPTQPYTPSQPLNVTIKVLGIYGNSTPPQITLTGTALQTGVRSNWDMYE